MPVETLSIAVLCVILLLTTFVQGSLVPLTHGFRWGLGSRDEPVVTTAIQGRFARCVQNQIESICIYVPVAAIVVFLDRTSEMKATASWLVIVGRTLFVPLYLGGVFGLRSAAYGVATVGILIMAFCLV
ncbi:MAPEG family protein [Erythrobacter sp. GH1-10]|uniref:MAPEG family protein n=1 Tax=Erythrobacter sp. GH1-10 TaxID=3349334 RepID=UPI0038780EF7